MDSEMIASFTLTGQLIAGLQKPKAPNLPTFSTNKPLKSIWVWLQMEVVGLLQFFVVIFASLSRIDVLGMILMSF